MDSCGKELRKMISNHPHRDIEWLAVDGDGYGVVLDLVGARDTVAREISGMFVAVELDVMLCGGLLCTVDKLPRITLA